jgi:hypothetical protein
MRKDRFCAIVLVLVMFVWVLSGCAGSVRDMREVPPGSANIAPGEGKAMVVFMRPSKTASPLQCSVFEVKGSELFLVGIVASRAKVAYRLEPGKHLFMVVGEGASFMNAEVVPNKIYYARITPKTRGESTDFVFEPFHKDSLNSPDFIKWSNACRLVEKTPDSDKWASTNMPYIKSKQSEDYKKWMGKPEAERPILLPEDGR